MGESSINPRAQGQARRLRHEQTPAEKTLWRQLRDRQLNGFKFRRQQPLGDYIVDFLCARRKLVVEIDGDTHADSARHDEERTRWLNGHGYRVIRFTNADVRRNPKGVLLEILRACGGDETAEAEED